MNEFICDECEWVGTDAETERLELGTRDGPEPTDEDKDLFRDDDGQMARTCPDCGNFVSAL